MQPTAEGVRERNEARCRRLLARSEVLDVSDLDWLAVGQVELEPPVIDALVYMRDVESFTPTYLKGLGAHPTTLSDPVVAEFLDARQPEEAAHAAALEHYLRIYGSARGVTIAPTAVARPAAPGWRERTLGHLGGRVGEVIAAGHMTWGAANELLTMNGYRTLATACGDPVLAELLSRIAAQEARHYSFYLLQAEWRLGASRMARVVLPRVMRRSWTPVGIGEGYKTAEDFRRATFAFKREGAVHSLLERMDRRLSALPGLEDVRIFQSAVAAPGS